MSLAAGSKLGPYEILALIGVGGMGEVYRAHDPRMGREVAIKICAERFSDRFSREVHAVAALNHPNICHLYDVGPNYLVMELVEGPTLAERIKQGAAPLDEALKIAKQIAEALEAAHEKGIVHRDLKPGNIKIRPDGMVKVLDFGLAKIAETTEPGTRTENSPTLTLDAASRVGMILGTAAYMPPEQARGKPVDKRADIWAFGVVLYEMLTGERLFEGETVSDTLIEVATKEPALEQVPEKVRRLLGRCLEKDPKRRLRDIGEAGFVLEDTPQEGIVKADPSRLRFGIVASAVAGLLAVALAALAWIHFREQPTAAELTQFQIPLPAGESFSPPLAPFEVSPDGRELAFVTASAGGIPHVWIRSLDALEARLLPIEISPNPQPFFWSYDSRFLVFWSSDHKLKKVDVSGGPAQTLCDAPLFFGGSWNRDGVILFVDPAHGVMRVSAAGGTPAAVTTVDPARQQRAHLFPEFLPDGRHFIYFILSALPGSSGIYLGTIDAKPAQQNSKPLLANDSYPEYYVSSASSKTDSKDGYLLFYREGAILAQAFHPDKLELSGDPVPAAEQVGGLHDLGGSGGGGLFSASSHGVLIYLREDGIYGGNSQLSWFDREGKNLGTVWEPGIFGRGALSPDGKQAAVSRREAQSGKTNLWLLDLTRGGASTPFTLENTVDDNPVWSPDGSRIVFTSTRDGPPSLFQKPASGVKNEEPLLNVGQALQPNSWSRDGRFLLYTAQGKAKGDLWILPMEGSKKEPLLFQGTEFNESAAQFSPDGRWIAYQSDESGHYEIFVREFLLGSDGEPEATAKHQVSNGGGIAPYWTGDGRELIFEALDQRTLMSSEIATKPGFQASPAKALGQLPAGAAALTMTADGKRVLASVAVGRSGPQQFTVVLNWQAGLRK